MLIDCDSCRMRDLACSDCVVTLLLGTDDASFDLDEDEAAAFGVLAAGGLTPPLRLVPIARGRPPGIDEGFGAGYPEYEVRDRRANGN